MMNAFYKNRMLWDQKELYGWKVSQKKKKVTFKSFRTLSGRAKSRTFGDQEK